MKTHTQSFAIAVQELLQWKLNRKPMVILLLLLSAPALYSQIAVEPSAIDVGVLGYTKSNVWGASNMSFFTITNNSDDDIYVGAMSCSPDRGNNYLLHLLTSWSGGIFGPHQQCLVGFYIHTKDTGIIVGNIIIPTFSRRTGIPDTLKIPITGRGEKLSQPFLTDTYEPDQYTVSCGTNLHAANITISLVNPTDDTLMMIDIEPENTNGIEFTINKEVAVYDSVGIVMDRTKPLPSHKTTLPTILLPTMDAGFSIENVRFWLPNSTGNIKARLRKPNGDTITVRSTIRYGYTLATQKLVLVGPHRYPLYIRYNEVDSTSLTARVGFNNVPADRLELEELLIRGPRSSQMKIIKQSDEATPTAIPFTMSCDSTIGRRTAGWNILFTPTLLSGRMTDTIVAKYSYKGADGSVVRDSSWWTFETVVLAPLGVPITSEQAGALAIWPNPSSKGFSIGVPDGIGGKEVSIQVIDMAGKVVKQESREGVSSNYFVETERVSPGYYMVIVSDSRGKVFRGGVVVVP